MFQRTMTKSKVSYERERVREKERYRDVIFDGLSNPCLSSMRWKILEIDRLQPNRTEGFTQCLKNYRPFPRIRQLRRVADITTIVYLLSTNYFGTPQLNLYR